MKAVKLITKILIIVLIALVSFVGVYVQKQNRMENQVKDYTLGMDLKGARVVTLSVSDEKKQITRDKDGKIVKEEDKQENGEYTTEEKDVNPDEVKNTDNYKKSKNIIEERLKQLGINQYNIKLDEESGKIVLEIPENDNTDHTVSNFAQTGRFQIVDSEDTEKVLMDNSDIKDVRVMYNTGNKGTTVYLSFEFNKTGTDKLKNISTEYVTVTESQQETSEEDTSGDENKEETKQKEITMQVDENKMITTSFPETMENGQLQLTMGQATSDSEKIHEYMESASTIATILDTGKLPVVYEITDNEFVASDITIDLLTKLALGVLIVVVLMLIILAIKYKGKGILAVIEFIGFAAIYLLLIRYTNVIITLEGLVAIAMILLLNYIFNYKMLNKLKENDNEEKTKVMKDSFIEFCIKIIPICILSIVCCFISWTPISSFGMTMFWGIILVVLYNLTVTRNFLNNK